MDSDRAVHRYNMEYPLAPQDTGILIHWCQAISFCCCSMLLSLVVFLIGCHMILNQDNSNYGLFIVVMGGIFFMMSIFSVCWICADEEVLGSDISSNLSYTNSTENLEDLMRREARRMMNSFYGRAWLRNMRNHPPFENPVQNSVSSLPPSYDVVLSMSHSNAAPPTYDEAINAPAPRMGP